MPELGLSESERMRRRIKRIRDGLRSIRDAVGDDRCWLDDYVVEALLAAAPPPRRRLPVLEEAMVRCSAFYQRRRANSPDLTPHDAIIDRRRWDRDLSEMTRSALKNELERLEQGMRDFCAIDPLMRRVEHDRRLYALLPERLPADFRLPPEPEFLGEAKPRAGCPAFWRSHAACGHDEHDLRSWGPCV